MANTAGAFGLRPVRHKSGAPYNGAANLYYYAGGGSPNLFIGDPVIVDGSANSAIYYDNPVGSLPTITIATGGNGSRFTGVIVGFFAEQATSTVYCPAAATRGVWVADDPDLVFEVQDDGVASIGYAGVQAGGNLTSGTGNIYTGVSGWVLSSTTGTNAADQVRIQRLAPKAGNAVGVYATWEVTPNYHTNVPGVAGV